MNKIFKIPIMLLMSVAIISSSHVSVFAQKTQYSDYSHDYIPAISGKPDFLIDTINMTNNRFIFSLEKTQMMDKKLVEIGVIWVEQSRPDIENIDPIHVYRTDYDWSLAAFSMKGKELEEGKEVAHRIVWELNASIDLQSSLNRLEKRKYDFLYFVRFDNNLMWHGKINFKSCIDEMNSQGFWKMGKECRAKSYNLLKEFDNVRYGAYDARYEKSYLQEISELKIYNEQAIQTITAYNDWITALLNERSRMLNEIDSIRNEMEKNKVNLDTINRDLETAQKDLATVNQNLEIVNKNLENANEDLEDKKQKLKELESEKAKIVETISSLTIEKKELTEKVNTLAERGKELLDKIEDIDKEREELLKKIDEKNNEIKNLIKEKEALEERLKLSGPGIEEDKMQIGELQKIQDELKREIENIKREEAIFRERIAKSEQREKETYNTYNIFKNYSNENGKKVDNGGELNKKDLSTMQEQVGRQNEGSSSLSNENMVEIPDLGSTDKGIGQWVYLVLGGVIAIAINWGIVAIFKRKS